MTNLAANLIIGRITQSTGVPEALTAANVATIIEPTLDLRYLRSAGVNNIGIPGGIGFGVGICPEYCRPTGMIPMTGCYTLGHDNYGNYRYADGSIMCWIPKHYYKIGTGSNGLAVNVVDVKSIYDYADTATANSAGYALPRDFLDGGVEKPGYFVDKYKVSKTSWGSGYIASSIQNGNPISTAAAHNPIGDLTAAGGVNAYYPTIDCAHARDGVNGAVNASSIFHVASVFQRVTLARLALAHAQASASTTYCAWYDASSNFPKGCNNNALRDTNDTSVLYTSDGYSNCGKTGSGSPFAKTTHNGQACGVADLNGLMWEISLGVTYISAAGKFYIAKQATTMKSFTSGNAGATDHWGATGVAAMMDEITLPDFGADGWKYFGNSTNQVFSEDTSGTNWLLSAVGIPKDTNGQSGSGTTVYGNDVFY
jgi:hypothetical protein